jgi:ribosomal protein S12 methylthiotransferase accessory factor
MTSIFERELNSVVAMHRIETIFKTLDISVLKQSSNDEFLVSRVTLEGKSGIESIGSGKGVYHKIGAFAESLEHYLTEEYLTKNDGFKKSYEISEQDVLKSDGVIQSLRKFSDSDTPVIAMQDFQNGEHIYIPHLLVNPLIDTTYLETNKANLFISRYSSNSGTAFGLTETEAQLHALMESIERHALSNLYLALVGQGNPQEFVYFNSSETYEIVTEFGLESTFPPFRLFGCKSVGGSYFFAAVEEDNSKQVVEIGSGCSMSAKHALERAITELAQSFGLYREGVPLDYNSFLKLADELPNLNPLKRVIIDYNIVKNGQFSRNINLVNILSEWTMLANSPSPKVMLETCISELYQEGFNVFQRTETFGQFGHMAQVFIPSLDRFHHIRDGLKVAPNRALL